MGAVNGLIPIMLVDDLDKAIDFYVRVLGLTETFRWGEPPFYAGVTGGAGIYLHINTVKENAGKGELYVTVDDVDAVHAAVTADGVAVEIELKTQDYGMRDFSVRDPAGNFLTIGSDSPQEPPG